MLAKLSTFFSFLFKESHSLPPPLPFSYRLMIMETWNYPSSSSSSWHAINTDIPDPLSPPFPIVHCFQQVFRTTSRIYTELLYVGSNWSSCFCSAMWRGPQEYITYELVLTSLAVSRRSGLSNLDSFRDGW